MTDRAALARALAPRPQTVEATPQPKPPPRRSKHADLPEGRDECQRQARGLCEVRVDGVCVGQGDQAHHRLRRSQGGPDTADNLLWVCRFCHSYLHAHPAESYRRGWLVRGLGYSTALRGVS